MNKVLKNANEADRILLGMLESRSILSDTLDIENITPSDTVQT